MTQVSTDGVSISPPHMVARSRSVGIRSTWLGLGLGLGSGSGSGLGLGALSRAESGACESEPRDMGTCLGSALGLRLGLGNLALALTLTLTERHGHLRRAHGYRAAGGEI